MTDPTIQATGIGRRMGSGFKDHTSHRFGRLVAVHLAPKTDRHTRWDCICDCGATVTVMAASLTSGDSRSCGCLAREMAAAVTRARSTHGHAGRSNGKAAPSPTYVSWYSMVKRCLNPTSSRYDKYGARGISVCERWRAFENFLADMGERPTGTSLDRIDVNGNYGPGNCRWATPRQQARNTTRNHRVSFRGETLTVIEWAEGVGVSGSSMWRRLKRWPVERALTESASGRAERR